MIIKLYEITVGEDVYIPIEKKMVEGSFTGTYEAESDEKAIEEAKEYYACEFGTTEDEVKIKSVKEIS